jgi:hypothetical protein
MPGMLLYRPPILYYQRPYDESGHCRINLCHLAMLFHHLQYGANVSLRYTEEDAPAKQELPPVVKVESAAPPAVKAEESAERVENSHADDQAYGGEQDVDDEIDFNLGNGNGYDAPASQQDAHGPGIKEDG